VGETEVKDNGLDIDQHGQFARFAMTADARCLVSDDPDTGKNWSSYPHADKPIVRVFQGVCNQRLAAGQRFSLFTVLHASGDKPSPVRVKRLNANRALVEGLGEPLLVALPDQTGAIPFVEGVSAKAAALLFSAQKAYALGVTEMPMVPAEQLGPTGADAEIDLRTGQASLKSPLGAGATTVQQLRTLTQPAPAPAAEVAGFLKMLAAAAPATVSPGGGLQGLAPLKSLWTYRQKLAAYALTNNASVFEAVDTGLKLSGSPQPLERNVFGDAPTNTLDNLADGVLLTTDGGVMWDTGQAVTLNLEFDNVYDVGKLDLRSWFATQSSRGKTYQLGQLQVLASNDGFKQDTRKLVDFTDDKTYGNWGNPNYGPQLYSFGDLKAKARQLRLILTPRPGSGIYLSELTVWGSRPGLENVLAQRKSGAPAHIFEATLASDLTGDKQTELLAGSSSGAVYCFSPQGDLRWQYEAGVKVNCLGAVDYQGNGQRTVLVGTADARMIALDATGKELWTFRPPYYKRAGHPRTIFPADLQGNGKQVAIVGAENWHYYAVDATGKQIWKYESVHGSTAGTAADLNGDKKDEIVAGTEYYWWHVINPDGSRRFGFNTSGGPCANAVATGNLLGDGKRAALFGGADTLVQVLSADGKLLWSFNTGDEVTGLACADVNGDGKDEVLVSSLSFNVYCLDGTGKMLWRQDLGDQVRALTVWQSQGQWLVGAGTDSKQVVVLQARDGKPVGGAMVADKVLGLTPVGAQAKELAVTVADGNLVVVAAPGN
jgi:outer membrane protein assembly factor BamB